MSGLGICQTHLKDFYERRAVRPPSFIWKAPHDGPSDAVLRPSVLERLRLLASREDTGYATYQQEQLRHHVAAGSFSTDTRDPAGAPTARRGRNAVLMPIQVRCANFTGPFKRLNGVQWIPGGRLKLLLAAISCGYGGFFASLKQHGLRRVAHIGGTLLPFIREDANNGLCLDEYYFAIDGSENKTAAYYMGQALTKLFSSHVLGAPLVIHASTCSWTSSGVNAGKVTSRSTGRKQPDLFGFGATVSHVLECKGRSSAAIRHPGPSLRYPAAMNEALAQVSVVSAINGRVPATRCGCVWTLSRVG